MNEADIPSANAGIKALAIKLPRAMWRLPVIRRPRPCFFLNPRGHAWQDNADFAHWRGGHVLDSFEQFEAAFAEVPQLTAPMRTRQERLFRYSFDLQQRPSSERAAEAILDYMARQ